MSSVEKLEEEEVSLFDLLEKFRKGWRHVAGGIFLGSLGASVVLFTTPKQYQATAVVQVGQVGQEGQAGLVSFTLAEPPAQAVERVRSSAFLFSVAKALGDQRWMAALQNGGGSDVLSVASPKGATHLIDLKAKADNPEAAKKIVSAATNELAKREAEIVKPVVDRMTREADFAREKIKHAELELGRLSKLLNGVGVKDERFTQISLITDLRVRKESEIFQQRQVLSALNDALAPPNTQPAKAIEDVFTSDTPVAPKKRQLLVLGLVGGLLAGVISMFISNAWRKVCERRLWAESSNV